MRIGGLASGINTDEIIEKMMAAERMPLDRMEQDKTTLEWKRDGFREINKALLELDNMMLDMKLSKTYNSKTVTSSMESAVTATATSSAANGSYKISVEKLATSAMNVSADDKTININKPIAEFNFSMTEEGEITFQTYDEDGKNVTHKVKIDYENDTIKDVLNKINEQDNNVQAFYDEQSKRVVLETTRTGKYNVNNEGSGKEIEFSENSFFAKVLHMDVENEKGGENSSFIYNDHLTLTSKDNNYTLNGITFSFHDTGTSTLTVDNDTEAAFDSIMAFVDKYNEAVYAKN